MHVTSALCLMKNLYSFFTRTHYESIRNQFQLFPSIAIGWHWHHCYKYHRWWLWTDFALHEALQSICYYYYYYFVGKWESYLFLSQSELRITESLSPPLVDTVIVCGEPKHWETPLQLLVDLLLTNGRPAAGNSREFRQTLPVILCNPDLQYMSRSCFPR